MNVRWTAKLTKKSRVSTNSLAGIARDRQPGGQKLNSQVRRRAAGDHQQQVFRQQHLMAFLRREDAGPHHRVVEDDGDQARRYLRAQDVAGALPHEVEDQVVDAAPPSARPS